MSRSQAHGRNIRAHIDEGIEGAAIEDDPPFILELAYPTMGEDAREWGAPDADMTRLINGQLLGMGTTRETRERDLTFGFDDALELEGAYWLAHEYFPFATIRALDAQTGETIRFDAQAGEARK